MGRNVLLIASQNVGSLVRHLDTACDVWRRRRYDIVMVQETRINYFNLHKIARKIRAKGWALFASLAHGHADSENSTGVAILVRLDSGIKLPAYDSPDIVRVGSRLISIPVDWGGHRVRLNNIYLKAGDAAAQRSFIELHVPAILSLSAKQIWGGDFNFVSHPTLDRLGGQSSAEAVTAGIWDQLTLLLTDQYRRLKPNGRGYSRVFNGSAARLDRFYTTLYFNAFVANCTIGDGTGFSDHRPIVLSLTARTSVRGPGLPRTRINFAKSNQLLESFVQWLDERISSLPENDLQLIQSWPRFKRALATECGRLNREFRKEQVIPSYRQAAEDLKAAYSALENPETDANQATAAFAAVELARTQLAAASNTQFETDSLRSRHTWFHRGERPQPALTSALRPPSGQICTGLRNSAQFLVTEGKQCANVMAQFWADISKQPDIDDMSQDEVLQCIPLGSCISQTDADTLGAAEVSSAEVLISIKKSGGNSAPGLDGLPFELYRRVKANFALVLASLFSAIGRVKQVPVGFLHGAICNVLKHDADGNPLDSHDPGNYRPITLLNSDYRLLTKVLANRANVVLTKVVDHEQSAFLRGRTIGDNVMLLLRC